MPVAAAIRGGRVLVDSGSRIARRGKSGKSTTSSLILRSGCLTTAAIDTSEPVPAVVGMHASGAISSGRPIPSSGARHQEEALLVSRASAVGEDRVGNLGGVHD